MKFALLLAVLLVSGMAGGQAAPQACQKSITFAVATKGNLVYRLPNVSAKWFDTAQKKLPNLCFAQRGQSSPIAEQFLIVLSTEGSSFNGLYPVYQTKSSTTSGPASGNGTIIDSQGSTWNYSYQGTSSSTTTTTEHTNLPYTDTALGLYATAYNEAGTPVGFAQRTETVRQGGDAANTLGYNIGARLSSIHLKERLLDEIASKVNSAPNLPVARKTEQVETSLGSATPGATMHPSEQTDDGTLWIHAANGAHNMYTFANARSISLPKTDDTASMAELKCIPDPKSTACFDNWSDAQKAFAWVLELGSKIRAAKSTNDDLLVTAANDLQTTWLSIKDEFCRQSPGAPYTDLDGVVASCPMTVHTK